MSGDAIKDRAAQDPAVLARRDRFMALLGAELVHAGAGYAAVRAQVRTEHLNFNGTCHGGFTFSLADMAFGLASNSHGVLAAGVDAHVAYLTAAVEGDVLTATAGEISRGRRVGTYGVEVAREDGSLVARFTGTVIVSGERNA